MLTLIVIVSLVLLIRTFRSVVLAVKAVVLNLLSVGATYGVLVLVWQQGHGSETIWNIPATGAITNFVPLMVFAFLFGLSMDYEVFILTRIREEYDTTADTTTAIVEDLGAPAGWSPAQPSSSPCPSSRFPRRRTLTSKSSPPASAPGSCSTPPSSAPSWYPHCSPCSAPPTGGCRHAWPASCASRPARHTHRGRFRRSPSRRVSPDTA